MERLKVNLISAVTNDFGIGSKNNLLVKLKVDMKYFKFTTIGHPVIMGARTFESMGCKHLPMRTNIVITSNPDKYSCSTAVVLGNILEAVEYCYRHKLKTPFIIGGGQVYKEVLESDYFDVSEIHLTHLDKVVEDADTFFPTLIKGSRKIEDVLKEDYNATIIQEGSEDNTNYKIVKYVRK